MVARSKSLRRRVAVVLWLLGVFAATQSWADRWYIHYDRAETALEAEDWRLAVEELNQAIERRADSGARVRSYGMNLVDYFPYFKLGIAYVELDEVEAALQAFDTEERLGAVTGSSDAARSMAGYRERAEQLQVAAAMSVEARREEVVREELAAARERADEGDYESAMAALDRVLAVSPDHPEAQVLMDSVRQQAAAAAAVDRTQTEVAELAEAARVDMENGSPRLAAVKLRRALRLSGNTAGTGDSFDGSEIRTALDGAEQAVREEIAAEDRAESITRALEAARVYVARGELDAAQTELEVVAALDPNNADAATLRRSIATARDEARTQAVLEGGLAEATAFLTAGNPEAALREANLLLATEPGNAALLDVIQRAYRELNRELLGASARENLPPAIRFADRRTTTAEGTAAEVVTVEVVTAERFRLTGVVIDQSEVTLVAEDDRGQPVELDQQSQVIGDDVLTEFSLAHRLDEGSTSLRVIATDAEGVSSSSVYQVEYRPPWYVRPIWRWGAVGFVALIGLGVVALRSRSRYRRLRRRFNPYVAGGPVFDRELFFGREPIVQRVLEAVHNNSLLLHGERRIGKTSLLHQIKHRLATLDDPEYRFYPVYVDLQGVLEERFFAVLAEALFDELAPVLGSEFAEPSTPLDESYRHHHLQADLRRLIRALRESGDRHVKVVLLIDEVDELNHYDPRTNQRLRSLFMKSFAEHLTAVVAGVRIRREWDREGSPWYNFFEEIEVEGIGTDEARRLVTQPIRGVFRVRPEAAERIVTLAEHKPYRIQKLCLALVNRLHDQGRTTVTVEDVEAVWS
ncbi:MAG: AAA family ATPase [Acidobacteriota bacterium]